jgi:hypothetical protein
MPFTLVITYSYTDGSTLTVCGDHERDVPDFTRSGASYAGVRYGAHRGECDICRSGDAHGFEDRDEPPL